MGNEVSGELPPPSEGPNGTIPSSMMTPDGESEALMVAQDCTEKIQAGFRDVQPPQLLPEHCEPSSPSQARLFTENDVAPGADSLAFYSRRPQGEGKSKTSAGAEPGVLPPTAKSARRALTNLSNGNSNENSAPASGTKSRKHPKTETAAGGENGERASNTGSPSAQREERARLITVGSRIKSQQHFHDWLNSPDEDALKLRSPGKHYTSATRVALVSPSRRLGIMWSEGNRFIRNNDL